MEDIKLANALTRAAFGRTLDDVPPQTRRLLELLQEFVAAQAQERGLTRLSEITKPILERWQRHLYLHRKQDGGPLSIRSQIADTQPLMAFFKWLAKEGMILFNPASELELPRAARKLPRTILTTSEAERTLAAPNIVTPMACAIGPCWRRCIRLACAGRRSSICRSATSIANGASFSSARAKAVRIVLFQSERGRWPGLICT